MDAVRLGVAGLGRGFMLSLPALRAHPAIRLAGAYDIRSDARARFATEFDAADHSTLDGLLADQFIDAIYVATPHEFHAEQTIAALNAGKHVLVEKPMATSVAECAAMARCATANDRVLIVGPSHGFDEQIIRAAQLVASGEYGPVRLVTTFNFTDFMYRPRRPEELDDARGGGVIYSQAAHQIDVVRRIIGQDVTGIRAVTGNWDTNRSSDGAYAALMTFAGGAAASLTYSGYGHYDSDELVGWIGELGQVKDPGRYGDARRKLASLSREDEIAAKLARTYGMGSDVPNCPPHNEHFGFLLVSCERADFKVLPNSIEVFGDEVRDTIAIAPPTIPRTAVVEEFASAIAGEKPPVHDGTWGLTTTACCAALAQSSQTGTGIDPQTIIQEQSES